MRGARSWNGGTICGVAAGGLGCGNGGRVDWGARPDGSGDGSVESGAS